MSFSNNQNSLGLHFGIAVMASPKRLLLLPSTFNEMVSESTIFPHSQYLSEGMYVLSVTSMVNLLRNALELLSEKPI